jgi:hypothetical protein
MEVSEPIVVAHYLPQFHPVPENDEWYGPGFTEWHNVGKARPLFPGHRVLRPTDLGYYQLPDASVFAAQQRLADRFGVDGMFLWHYWFNGRRILERPSEALLADPSIRFRYALCWANETWRGTWFGAPKRTLIEQTYSPGDAQRHIEAIAGHLADDRYVRVSGRPLFGVYRPSQLPEPERFLDALKTRASQLGLGELYLVGERAPDAPLIAGLDDGFLNPLRFSVGVGGLSRQVFHHARLPWLMSPARTTKALNRVHERCDTSYIPTVLPHWDNTPRSVRKGAVLVGNNAEFFASQCDRAFALARRRAAAKRPPIVLVKSWNEWAEGNVLEPSDRFGETMGLVLRAARDRHVEPRLLLHAG